MRVLTSGGSIVPVRKRFNFVGSDLQPFGWGSPSGLYGWSNGTELLKGAGGERLFSSFHDIYLSNPWVFACVNLISWGLARLPLKVYEPDGEGDYTEVRPDVVTPGRNSVAQNIAKVLRRPAPRTSPVVMLRKAETDFLINGNALLEKTMSGSAGLSGLRQRPWRRVNVVLDPGTGDVSHYEILPFGSTALVESRQLIPEDVVHIEIGNDPEWPVGMSPMHALKHTIALHNAIQRHMTAFFANQMRTSGHLKMEKGTKREVLAWVREELAQLYASPENAGRPLVTTGEWQPISTSPEHASIIELVHESREEIAAVYGAPPPLIGILDRAIMGNIKELRNHFMRQVVGTWAVLFETSLGAQVLDSPATEGCIVQFDLDESLRPDFEALAVALRNFQNTLTLNERRAIVKKPKIDAPDADAVFLDLNQGPVGDSSDGGGGDGPADDPTTNSNGHKPRDLLRIGPSE